MGKATARGKRTTGLNTKEFSEFCERVEAWAVSELGMVI